MSFAAVIVVVWTVAVVVLLALLRAAKSGDIALNQTARTWPADEPDRRETQRRANAPDAERPRWRREPVAERRSGGDRRAVSGP
ncbi:MAG TPA: hypothetical protein VIL49_01935 [Capillimicrobium sp.]|jgi:hypothetical protein